MKRNCFFFRVHLPARYEGNNLNKFMLTLLFVYGSIITYMYHGCLKFHFFSWLITPFRDNGHLTAQQRRFNRALSSIRQKIERAISLLKGRWRKLLLPVFFITSVYCTMILMMGTCKMGYMIMMMILDITLLMAEQKQSEPI